MELQISLHRRKVKILKLLLNIMPKHFKLLAAVLLAISMTTTVIGYAANTDSSKLKAKGEQNELSETQQDGRKKLKQKLRFLPQKI